MERTAREAKPAGRRATLGSRIRWSRIVRPQEEDLAWLRKTFGIHSLILDELKGPSARESAQALGKYLYLVYYFPIYDAAERVSRRSEVDFLITANGVITVSYEPIDALEQLAKTLPPGDRAFADTLALTHKLIETLLLFQQRQLVHIREKVEGISAELFKYRERERERSLLERISYLKRDISQYHIIVSPQKHVLESLFAGGKKTKIWDAHAPVYLNDLVGEHLKILEQLANYRQAVEDCEETNNQLINLKNTQVTKTFTILAFLTFPMMLLAALFSMDVGGIPLAEHPYGFWIILGAMAVAISGMIAYFKKRDWI